MNETADRVKANLIMYIYFYYAIGSLKIKYLPFQLDFFGARKFLLELNFFDLINNNGN